MMKGHSNTIAMMLAALMLLAFNSDAANGDFIWAGAMGGTSDDYGHLIAVDNVGNVYTTDYFYGTADFDLIQCGPK